MRRLQIKKFKKTEPPKVGILFLNTISKCSNTKKLTQKRPPKIKKNPKNILGDIKYKSLRKQTPQK